MFHSEVSLSKVSILTFNCREYFFDFSVSSLSHNDKDDCMLFIFEIEDKEHNISSLKYSSN